MKKNVWILLLLTMWACEEKHKKLFYSITVEAQPVEGGKVVLPPGPFESGKQVEVSAVPEKEYLFKEWSGDASGSDNPLKISMNANKNLIAHFEKKTYKLEIQTEGGGSVKEEIVRDARASGTYPSGTRVRLTAQPDSGWIFEKWEGDVSGTTASVELTVDTPKTVKAVFKEDLPVSIQVEGVKRSLFLNEECKVVVKVTYTSGKVENADISKLTMTSVGGIGDIEIHGDTIKAVKGGGTGLWVGFGKLFKVVLITVIPAEEVTDFDPFLATPAAGASVIIPVVVINYLPTLDGVNLDMNRAPDDFYQLRYSTLEEAKQRIAGELKITKFGIEEGTRFRQYNSTVPVGPYVGIKVVKYFNFYELKMKEWKWNGTMKTPDYHDLFSMLEMRDLVDNQGVKEVWITMFNKDKFPSIENGPYDDPSTYYGIPESNMSSPLTGDISNSHRDPDDLPVYSNTYIVYGNSAHRGADTNLHNRGHQLEAQFSYVDELQGVTAPGDRLFWNYFAGLGHNPGSNVPSGRVGATHFPPNAIRDYDYDNPTFVKSDIQTWSPAGGEFIDVNSYLWKSARYNFDLANVFFMNGQQYWNDYNWHAEFKWLLYWWQSIPGRGNNISFRGTPLTNWWHVFYNWDEVIRTSGGLLQTGAGRNSRLGVVSSGRQHFPVCTHSTYHR